ncbi:MAG TPA: aminotransferase class V-fold PLP-dependent enzyme [Puia sp.]|jgi:selenocysteine lyase/cysteine desulfurase|nr:aminotransferase class V-fold PLP-dependent enzyme [Puia sp.]
MKSMTLAGLGLPFAQKSDPRPATLADLKDLISQYGEIAPATLAENEEFWTGIRAQYNLKPDYANLENGYYNIQPTPVLEAFLRHVKDVNYEGAFYMRTVQFDRKKAIAARLAALGGCTTEELVITRNTTESLDMIIAGYPWKPGDEAIVAEQDYPAMLAMFRQVEKRHGIIVKRVSVPNHPASDADVISVYEQAITPRTRLMMVCHMINITGQVLPVRKISDMAHSHGVEVMIDAAHTYAHIRHTIPELGGDYYAASLHKWLSAPLGAGILYVKKEHQAKIWPLFAEPDGSAEGIARLNHTGTLPVHTDLAIGDALDYYTTLGAERKEARLRYLQQYWTSKIRDVPGIVVNTPADPTRGCAIANVGIKNIAPGDMAARLLQQYRIYTVAIDYPAANVRGCRITPNVYTLTTELDRLVAALRGMASASA